MLIRTQDRKTIVNFNNITKIYVSENWVYAEDIVLGKYKTHERAMEVLDALCVTAEFKSMMILTMMMPEE